MINTRITIACQSYRVRHESEHIVLEIENAKPTGVVSQLMTKAQVASKLELSERKIETLAASGRLPVVRIDGSVRFREEDVFQFLVECTQEPVVTLIPRRDARN